MSQEKIEELQRAVCSKYSAEYCPAMPNEKLGISESVRRGALPINGLRHPPAGDTSGWYVWGGGELSDEADFFKPLHVEHIDEWCPGI